MAALSRRTLLWALAGLPLMGRAQPAPPAEVSAELSAARLQGQGKLSFLGLSVSSARLWVGSGFKADEFTQAPLALELEYARTLYGQLIAERSLAEMKKVGDVPADKAERWLAEMTKTFPDVKEGDRITGMYKPNEAMRFFVNGTLRGSLGDVDFAKLFIGIWLSPRTSEPKLRLALLGTAP